MRTRGRVKQTAVSALATASAAGLCGCGSDGKDLVAGDGVPSAATSSPTPAASRTPVLLTEPNPGGPRFAALVGGTLRIDKAGCFALDEFAVIAPAGSTVVDDGAAVELTGMGRFAIGDNIRGGGGYIEDLERKRVPDALRPCLPAHGPGNYISIYPDTR